MLTIEVMQQTEARINRFLADMTADLDTGDAVPASAYVLMLLADLLPMDRDLLNQALERIMPREVPPASIANAEREQILNAAVLQMKENQIRHRAHAVETITHKNQLAAEIATLEREEAYLKREAINALNSRP